MSAVRGNKGGQFDRYADERQHDLHGFGGLKPDQAKKCRACVDFNDLMKKRRGIDTKGKDGGYRDCPPYRQELGKHSWSLLHSIAAYFPEEPNPVHQTRARQFLESFSHLFPCEECADDLRSFMTKNQPKLSNNLEFSKWMCEAHNDVNRRIGKPIFDCEKVLERWRDGWSDGSCD